MIRFVFQKDYFEEIKDVQIEGKFFEMLVFEFYLNCKQN